MNRSFAAKAVKSGAIAPAYPRGSGKLHLVRLEARVGRLSWSARALCESETARGVKEWFPYAPGKEPNPDALCMDCVKEAEKVQP